MTDQRFQATAAEAWNAIRATLLWVGSQKKINFALLSICCDVTTRSLQYFVWALPMSPRYTILWWLHWYVLILIVFFSELYHNKHRGFKHPTWAFEYVQKISFLVISLEMHKGPCMLHASAMSMRCKNCNAFMLQILSPPFVCLFQSQSALIKQRQIC